MNLNSRVTLAVRNFFKKYGKVILIVFTIWIALFLFNKYLKNKPKELKATTSYNPNSPIMDGGKQIPKNEVDKFNSTIEEYFNYCNSKEYEKAMNMLTDECKSGVFNNSIKAFQEYIDEIYTKNKIYHLQNYSNIKNIYIYDMTILDDIVATGPTEGYEKYKEKIVVHNIEGGVKLSVLGYVGKTNLGIEAEDDNMKVKVLHKEVSYSKEEYNIEIRNKTDNYIVLSNGLSSSQITLNLGNQRRNLLDATNTSIVLAPGQTKTVKVLFTKYFDDGVIPEEINFTRINILSKLTNEEVKEEDKIREYSFNVKLK